MIVDAVRFVCVYKSWTRVVFNHVLPWCDHSQVVGIAAGSISTNVVNDHSGDISIGNFHRKNMRRDLNSANTKRAVPVFVFCSNPVPATAFIIYSNVINKCNKVKRIWDLPHAKLSSLFFHFSEIHLLFYYRNIACNNYKQELIK
jgi:hypothetical protein